LIWNSIPRPWQVCLEEAWTAYCAGSLRYAAREPFAGSINLLGTTPYLCRKPIQIFGLADTALEILVTALAVARDLFYRCNANNIVIQAWREVIPSGVVVGEQLHQAGTLRQMQAEGCTAEHLFESISEIISP